MTVKIDLKKGTVEVSSSNELYGKNPYMVLTTAPARIAGKYVNGTAAFAGTNVHDRTSNVLSFDPKTKTGSLEVMANKQLSISDLKCR